MKTQISKQNNNVVAVQPQTTFHKEDRMKAHSFTTMSLLKKTLLAAVIMACVIVPATVSAQTCTGGSGASKVLNGGFQIGSGTTTTDWTVAWPASVDPYVSIGGNGQGGSSQSLALGSTPGENRISQTIPGLTAGQTYVLCFWLSNGGSPGPNSFEATWNDNNSFQIINTDSFGYTYYSFVVEAVGGGHDVLSFEERNSPSYFYLDNVALQLCSGCSLSFSMDGPTKPLPENVE
jgi:hypothetical protein